MSAGLGLAARTCVMLALRDSVACWDTWPTNTRWHRETGGAWAGPWGHGEAPGALMTEEGDCAPGWESSQSTLGRPSPLGGQLEQGRGCHKENTGHLDLVSSSLSPPFRPSPKESQASECPWTPGVQDQKRRAVPQGLGEMLPGKLTPSLSLCAGSGNQAGA